MKTPIEYGKEKILQRRVDTEWSQDVSPLLDESLLAIANKVAASNPLFKVIDDGQLESGSRPDSIMHDLTVLPPNNLEAAETRAKLGYLNFLFEGEVPRLTDTVNDFAADYDLFPSLKETAAKPGEKFIIALDHPDIANLAYAAGLFHLSAREFGVDELKNHLAILVGRAVGYLKFDITDENVMDDVLRPIGSIVKTYPTGGNEALDEETQIVLKEYCKRANEESASAILNLLRFRRGKLIFVAFSGEGSRFDANANESHERAYSEGSRKLLKQASELGATVIPACMDRHRDDNVARSVGSSVLKFGDPIPAGEIHTDKDCHILGKTIADLANSGRMLAAKDHPSDPWYTVRTVYDGESSAI